MNPVQLSPRDRYNQAVANWMLAKRLWFRVINNLAKSRERIRHLLEPPVVPAPRVTPDPLPEKEKAEVHARLGSARRILEELAPMQFLKSSSYLDKVKTLQKRIQVQYFYERGLNLMKLGDDSEDKQTKLSCYSEARQLFSRLNGFQKSQDYEREAIRKQALASIPQSGSLSKGNTAIFKLDNAFAKPAPVEEKEESDNSFKVLIEGGHDICLRKKLPALGSELIDSLIITPQGFFQLDQTEEKYICILGEAELRFLEMQDYLRRARELQVDRLSIRGELSAEQLDELNEVLVTNGGRAVQVESERAPVHNFR